MKKKERFERYKYTMGLNAWEASSYMTAESGVIVMNDGPCGVRKPAGQDFEFQEEIMVSVCMPSPCALAASFDTELVYENGTLLAADCISKNVNILLAPGINIKRNVLCGRNFEYFSEDPYLAGVLAAEYVKGLEENGVGACVKHYCCNNQEYFRQTVSSEVSPRALNEIYLRPFALVCRLSEPTAFMTSYNMVNGEYPGESEYFLQTKLRGEFGFGGLIMSDWCAVRDKGKAIKSGLNLEMPLSGRSPEYIERLNEKGDFTLSELKRRDDEFASAVSKFNKPAGDKSYDMDAVHANAGKIAERTMILVKNEDGYLPLNTADKLLVIGYFAKNARYVGGGSGWVNAYIKESFIDILENTGANFTYIEGFNESGLTVAEEDLLAYKKCGYKVLLFLGLFDGEEGEGRDRKDIILCAEQDKLVDIISNIFKDFATVLVTGSVVDIKNVYEKSTALLITYLAGEGQSRGIYNNLFGLHNPCGRLPESWISSLSQHPLYEEYKSYNPFYAYYDEDIFVGYRYFDINKSKQFMLPFGYGLSYSQFEYSDFSIRQEKDKIICSLNVSNISKFDGSDVVQVYSSMPHSSIYRPKKELKGFKKAHIKSGQSKRVDIEILNLNLESFDEESGKMAVEAGDYIFMFARNADDVIYRFDPVYVSGEKFAESKTPKRIVRKKAENLFKYETPVGCAIEAVGFQEMLSSFGLNEKDIEQIVSNESMPLVNITYIAGGKVDFFKLDKLLDMLNNTVAKNNIPDYRLRRT